MKINFEQAEFVMDFINKAENLFGTERPVSYQYMSYMAHDCGYLPMEHIKKQIRSRPEVYERALRDLKPRMTEEIMENARLKYAEFEQFYQLKKQEEGYNL